MGVASKSVGGQAVIDGVMMRGIDATSVAIRRKNGDIIVQDISWKSFLPSLSLSKIPFLRGMVVFLETVYNGLCVLKFSAIQNLEEEASFKSVESRNYAFIFSFIIALFLVSMGFVALPHVLTEVVVSDQASALFQLVDGGLKIFLFVSYLLFISRFQDVKKLFEYHGAEHKAIHTYEAGEELTVQNAKKYTTLHPRCGTSFVVFILISSLLVFTFALPLFVNYFFPISSKWSFLALKVALLFPIAGISYEWIKMTTRRENFLTSFMQLPGLYLQRITTREPHDEQLEVALAALKRVISQY